MRSLTNIRRMIFGVVIICFLGSSAFGAPRQYIISGFVQTSGGSGVEGVSVVGDNGAGSAVTDADGAYSVTVPNNWSGTITVSRAGWLITPPSKTYIKIRENKANENYTAYQPKISGNVFSNEGLAISGATISASGGFSAISDSDGYYELMVPYGWNGSINVTATGYYFGYTTYLGTVVTDRPNVNFTGFRPKISGSVKDAAGFYLHDVVITADNGGGSKIAILGSYEIFVPYGWSGTLTASLTGYGFTEKSYTNVTTDQANQNFTGYQPKISGYVRKADGTALSSATVSASGGASTTTNASGYYEIIVPYGWTGTISAALAGYSFTAKSYTNVTTDQANQNFTGYQPKISGYVKKADGTAISSATVSASGGASTTTNASGYYEIIVSYGWSGTVTASKAGYSFTAKSYTNVITEKPGQDFTGYQPKISGYVLDGSGAGVAAVSITADNGGGSAATDASGYYEIIVPYNWSGMVTAQRAAWQITPEYYSYNNLTVHQSNQDFTAFYTGIVNVKPDGTGDYATIQAAIDAAANGDNVILQPGTYTGTGNRDINFLGKAITVRGATGDPNDCIIDCQGTEAEPHRGFDFVSGEGANSVLEGLTITHGYSSSGGGINCHHSGPTINSCIINNNSTSSYDGHGGGIYNYDSSPNINNCTISGNSATYSQSSGGGICNYNNSNPSINNCIISNNSANLYGGGIYNNESDPIIDNCSIINNSSLGRGGGIYNYSSSSPTIINCTISNNSANLYGGGIYNNDSGPIIDNCIVVENSARWGGGIYNYLGNPTISHCAVKHNSAAFPGGGFYNDLSNAIIYNCTISYNSAGSGGGFYNYRGDLIISNCIISYNLADHGSGFYHSYCDSIIKGCVISNNSANFYGGGFLNYYSSPGINNCTISNNSATSYGGGVYSSSSNPTISSCIIWGNGTSQIYGSVITVKYSNIQGGYTGAENVDEDPLFAADGFHLTAVSPCIDAGDPNYTPDVNETDIDGDPRVVGRIDMGADEVYSSTSALIVIIPGILNFEAEGLPSNSQSQDISIKNYGIGTLDWQIQMPNDCNWLSVSPTAGSITDNNSTVEIAVDPSIAGYGTHSCQLQVTAADAENSPLVVTVNLEVLGPQIGVNNDYFYFTAYGKSDTSVAEHELIITNTGFDTLNWHTEIPDCNWLSVAPQSGQVTDGNSVVAISVDPTKAPAYGYNYATINIIDENASNSPQAATARLRVFGPSMYVNPYRLIIYAERNTKVERTFEIINTGYDILHWNIETPNDCNWLEIVEPLSGECAAEESDIVTVTVDANGLEENNDYSTQLLIHSPECGEEIVNLKLIVYTSNEIHVPQDYPTIQEAVNAALTGDIIIVHPGRYAGFDVDKPVLTIRSIEPENPAVVAATIIESGGYVHGNYGNEAVINGLSFIYPAVPDRSENGIYISRSSDVQIKNCRVLNFPGAGICALSERNNPTVTISNCVISNNGYLGWGWYYYPGGIITSGSANIENCLITGNFGGGILAVGPSELGGYKIYIRNNTIADNFSDITKTSGRGITCGYYYYYYPGLTLSLQNSITSNTVGPNDVEIFIIAEDDPYPNNINLDVAYSNIKGGLAAVSTPIGANVVWGQGNIDADPCFVEPGYWVDANDPNIIVEPNDPNAIRVDGDYHLKSEGWRWDAQRKVWKWDDVTSRCIDAGNPGSPLGQELLSVPDDLNNEWGQNLRINMGAYGGTAEASMPPYDWALLGDLTNDGKVGLNDLAAFADYWPDSGECIPSDLNRNQFVDFVDFALFAQDWFLETSWYSP